ncbi:MAG: TonB family protein, partial [Bacteroidota bacterium]
MKTFFTSLLSLFSCLVAFGQAETIDTSYVYPVAERMPMVAVCAAYDTTYAAQQKCSQDVLLSLIYKNVNYPDSARMQGIEGTVVVSFVVNPDSMISDVKLARDIGGGCGQAALYVINALNPLGLKWAPGQQKGVPVKVMMNVPVKFKLKEIPPYDVVDGDTVYNKFDKPLSFKGGGVALEKFIEKNLKYPKVGNDSCTIGTIEVEALVEPSGVVGVMQVNDFSNLGFDYQFEAISTTTATINQWDIAEYEGRKVPAAYSMRMNFEPTAAKCATKITQFEEAQQIAVTGSNLFNEGKKEEGIVELSKAIELFPNNAEYLYARGNAYLDMKNYLGACEDFTKAKEILLFTWVDN